MARNKKLYAGVGAKCTILTRFIHPKVVLEDNGHRTKIELLSKENKKINKKQQEFFVFLCLDGPASNTIGYSVRSHIVITEEGNRADFFFSDDVAAAEKRQKEENFIEPKIKWRKSQAKKLLHAAIIDGKVPENALDNDGNEIMKLEEIYGLHQEFLLYDFTKFAARLASVRADILSNKDRSLDDMSAFELYLLNHNVSLYSRKGYIQWQGSDAQCCLLEDISNGCLLTEQKPKELWESRQEYYENFPLDVFRKNIQQEVRTAKYLHTIKTKGISYHAS
jgi:hypothetical protein